MQIEALLICFTLYHSGYIGLLCLLLCYSENIDFFLFHIRKSDIFKGPNCIKKYAFTAIYSLKVKVCNVDQ